MKTKKNKKTKTRILPIGDRPKGRKGNGKKIEYRRTYGGHVQISWGGEEGLMSECKKGGRESDVMEIKKKRERVMGMLSYLFLLLVSFAISVSHL